MTFNIDNFGPIGNSSKPISGVGTSSIKGYPSKWGYATADAINTVTAAGYFNTVSAHLNVGDDIEVLSSAGSGGTMAKTYVTVISNASGVVDVSDGTSIDQTDTY